MGLEGYLDFVIKLGIELEFYSDKEVEFFEDLIARNFGLINRVFKEKGKGQYEISTAPTEDLGLLIEEINLFKRLAVGLCDFSAKPCIEQPGSALHVHISLHDVGEVQKNIIRLEPKLRSFIVGGLCHLMRYSMICFAPNISSYRRFQYYDKFTPRFINWGFEENKSNAVRVTHNTIEHRVAGADADHSQVVGCIIDAIKYGISNKIIPCAPNFKESQYIDAFQDRLPLSYSEAVLKGRVIPDFASLLTKKEIQIVKV